MSQKNTNTENYRDDEIDLRKLFQSIGKGFANIGSGFINMIIRIRRASITYKFLILIMVGLGAVAGLVFNKATKPVYSTSLLLSSDYFNNKLFENNIDKLNALCKEGNSIALSKLLNIEVDVASSIKKVEFEPMVTEQDVVDAKVFKEKLEILKVKDSEVEKILEQIDLQNNTTYKVIIYVLDNNVIVDLEESIVAYFRNSPFVKNRIDATKKGQSSLINKLSNDIKQLDSLKKLFNLNLRAEAGRKGETSSNSLLIGESSGLDPVRFYAQSIRLYEQLQETQQQLELGDDFEVIDGFTVFSKPESPGIIKAIALSMLLFIGLAYLIIILLEINKYLNNVEKERFKKLEE